MNEKLIDQEAIFIDGPKIEANANKFSFVWRKSSERFHQGLIEKSNQLYDTLLEEKIIPTIERECLEELTVAELNEVVQKVDEVITMYDEKIDSSADTQERKKLRSERKFPKQARKQLIDFIERKQKYLRDFEIFGTRNSYSKTDHDATFMRMKDERSIKSRVYNIQIATEGQYTLAYDVFSNPTDTRTLIPFLDKIEEDYFDLPKHIVADAGYGSEQNYNDIISNRGCEALITYNLYLKEQKRKYKNDEFKTANWQCNEEKDEYTCPNQQQLIYKYDSVRTDRYGF